MANGMGKRLLPWGDEATILVCEDGKKKRVTIPKKIGYKAYGVCRAKVNPVIEPHCSFLS